MTGGCATNKSILFRKPLAVGKNSWLRAFLSYLFIWFEFVLEHFDQSIAKFL